VINAEQIPKSRPVSSGPSGSPVNWRLQALS
jgi:hypothetical protein